MQYWFSFFWITIYGSMSVSGWNLATYDDAGLNFITNNNDYEIVHVSVYYVRSFLTIRNRNESNDQITVIESTWPENLIPIQSRVFPNELSHAKTPANCNGIVKTTQTAVDRPNGLLWLLDNGSKYCTPKLIVFDLLRGNNEVHRCVFSKLKEDSLKSIHLYESYDMEPSSTNAIISMSAIVTTYALILLHNSKFIIQYSLLENRVRKLSLIVPMPNRPYEILVASELTLKNEHELIIKDFSNGLWIGDLSKVQRNVHDKDVDFFVEVKYLGALLGAAKAITMPTELDDEINKYLYYYLPRDGAVVRWNIGLPLRAEGHEVLYLTRASIAQIMFGAKGSVWIVYEQCDQMGDHCRRILNFSPFNGSRLIL